MNYEFVFLRSLQTGYFSELDVGNIDDILSHINPNTTVLFTEISEQMIVEHKHLPWYSEFEKFIQKYNIPYYFVLDSFYKDAHAFKSPKVKHYNYMYLLIYWLYVQGNNPRASTWNSDLELGLFLTGKVWKDNRGPLLYKFFSNNKLSTILWSFYDSKENLNLLRCKMSDMTDLDFQQFLQTCIRVLDLHDRKEMIDNSFGFTHNSYPLDISLYEKTSFSVITETHFDPVIVDGVAYPMVSEKTFRAIINYHPFIMAGAPGILDKLESLGFKTFREYLIDPSYNDYFVLNRLERTYNNVITFGDICKNNREKILSDVIHNAKLLEKICTDEANKLINDLDNDTSILDNCIKAHRIS